MKRAEIPTIPWKMQRHFRGPGSSLPRTWRGMNAAIDFATFHSGNEETTSFLNRKEIAVSFLVLENPSRKSGVNPYPLGWG